jgi:hypothetical protein
MQASRGNVDQYSGYCNGNTDGSVWGSRPTNWFILLSPSCLRPRAHWQLFCCGNVPCVLHPATKAVTAHEALHASWGNSFWQSTAVASAYAKRTLAHQHQVTERRGRVVNTPVSYSRRPRFKYRHWDRLSWLRFFVVLLSSFEADAVIVP